MLDFYPNATLTFNSGLGLTLGVDSSVAWALTVRAQVSTAGPPGNQPNHWLKNNLKNYVFFFIIVMFYNTLPHVPLITQIQKQCRAVVLCYHNDAKIGT